MNDIHFSFTNYLFHLLFSLLFINRGKGPLKNTSDVISAAKKIAEAGSRMDKLGRTIADNVRIKRNPNISMDCAMPNDTLHLETYKPAKQPCPGHAQDVMRAFQAKTTVNLVLVLEICSNTQRLITSFSCSQQFNWAPKTSAGMDLFQSSNSSHMLI
jgi:hypothetical protein